MSTFLTQGALYTNSGNTTNTTGHKKTSSSLQVPSKPTADEQTLQSALLYAPFVKPQDKVKTNSVAEMSFSDFQPKRFALNYEPPMIILEYLVPSTGKLYHHKMKLR
jgi:hypothetical protein